MKIIGVGDCIQFCSESDTDTFNLGKITMKFYQGINVVPSKGIADNRIHIEVSKEQLIKLLLSE